MKSLIAVLILATLWSARPSANAAATKKVKKASQQQALMKIAEYILKNGVVKSINAPLSRTLGYDLDIVETRALRQKKDIASDKREHGFYVVFTSDKKGHKTVKEIILANILLTEREGKRYIEGINARINSDGKLIALVLTTGFEGEVKQERLNSQSETAKSRLNDELSYQLNHIDFFQPNK